MFRHIGRAEFPQALEYATRISSAGTSIRRPEPPGDGADVRGPAADLRRARPGGTRASGRGHGRGSRRRGVPDRGRARLLLDDRGLPGDRGLPPDGRVDGGADTLVRRPAGPGAVHRSVRGPPRPDHAVPRCLRAGARRARRSPWSGTAPTAWTPRPVWRSTSAGRCSGSAATTTRPPRRTTRQRRTATSRNPAWLCCGWPAAAPRGGRRRTTAARRDARSGPPVPGAAGRGRGAPRRRRPRRRQARPRTELDAIAAAFDTPTAHRPRGLLPAVPSPWRRGDPAGALSSLRRGWQLWIGSERGTRRRGRGC